MKCSFVIPAYNSAHTLHPAIHSCLLQTYKDIEIVVVDDGSTDTTSQYLEWAQKQEWANLLKIVKNEKNMGRSYSRNIGNKLASGSILLVLDADDIATPKRAEWTVEKFKAGSLFVHGAAYGMDEIGNSLGKIQTDVFVKDKALKDMENRIVHSTVAYSKDLALRYPYAVGIPEKLGLDDWQQQVQMALDGVRFDYAPQVFCNYRAGDGVSATRDPEEVKRYKIGFLEGMLAHRVAR